MTKSFSKLAIAISLVTAILACDAVTPVSIDNTTGTSVVFEFRSSRAQNIPTLGSIPAESLVTIKPTTGAPNPQNRDIGPIIRVKDEAGKYIFCREYSWYDLSLSNYKVQIVRDDPSCK